jgi:RNA polymerase sigma-70 factor (ECF subfamily)
MGAWYGFAGDAGPRRHVGTLRLPVVPDTDKLRAMPADAELIVRIQRRDEAALSTLYDAYAPPLLGVATRMLGNRADAEEVVLDALVHLWREPGRFDVARGSLRAWLTVLVRSRALDLLRARQRGERLTERAARQAPEAIQGVAADSGDPSDPAVQDDDRRRVQAALAELPQAQREAIELAYYGGLSQSEIAERTGAPLGTVKTRIRDGMEKLRVMLRPLYAGGES